MIPIFCTIGCGVEVSKSYDIIIRFSKCTFITECTPRLPDTVNRDSYIYKEFQNSKSQIFKCKYIRSCWYTIKQKKNIELRSRKNKCQIMYIYLYLPNLSAVGPKVNFKRSAASFNSQFSFSYIGCLIKTNEPSLPCYLPINGRRIVDSCLSQGSAKWNPNRLVEVLNLYIRIPFPMMKTVLFAGL